MFSGYQAIKADFQKEREVINSSLERLDKISDLQRESKKVQNAVYSLVDTEEKSMNHLATSFPVKMLSGQLVENYNAGIALPEPTNQKLLDAPTEEVVVEENGLIVLQPKETALVDPNTTKQVNFFKSEELNVGDAYITCLKILEKEVRRLAVDIADIERECEVRKNMIHSQKRMTGEKDAGLGKRIIAMSKFLSEENRKKVIEDRKENLAEIKALEQKATELVAQKIKFEKNIHILIETHAIIAIYGGGAFTKDSHFNDMLLEFYLTARTVINGIYKQQDVEDILHKSQFDEFWKSLEGYVTTIKDYSPDLEYAKRLTDYGKFKNKYFGDLTRLGDRYKTIIAEKPHVEEELMKTVQLPLAEVERTLKLVLEFRKKDKTYLDIPVVQKQLSYLADRMKEIEEVIIQYGQVDRLPESPITYFEEFSKIATKLGKPSFDVLKFEKAARYALGMADAYPGFGKAKQFIMIFEKLEMPLTENQQAQLDELIENL